MRGHFVAQAGDELGKERISKARAARREDIADGISPTAAQLARRVAGRIAHLARGADHALACRLGPIVVSVEGARDGRDREIQTLGNIANSDWHEIHQNVLDNSSISQNVLVVKRSFGRGIRSRVFRRGGEEGGATTVRDIAGEPPGYASAARWRRTKAEGRVWASGSSVS